MQPLDEWYRWYDFDEHKRRAAEHRATRRANREAAQAAARIHRQRRVSSSPALDLPELRPAEAA